MTHNYYAEAFHMLYLHIDRGCTSGYAYTNPCIVVHSFYCCIGSKLSPGYDRLPLTLHDLVFQCVKHRHEQVNKLNFYSMQWRRSKVWCVFVAHDQQIRERNPRPSATIFLPYQMSGVLWKSRTLQSKSSMAIFWMGSPKCPLTSLFLGGLKCFQLFSSVHKGFPSRKWSRFKKEQQEAFAKNHHRVIERSCFWKPPLRMTPCMAPDQRDAGRPCCWVWPSAVSAASAVAVACPGVHWPPSLATGGHSCKRPWSRQNATLSGRIPLHPKLTLGSAKV